MFLVFMISGGVTIQAILYPNYPLGIDRSKYCAKQSKYGTKPDAINEYVFFNPTSRRDGTITQFIRIMFYLAFPLQSSQYFIDYYIEIYLNNCFEISSA